LDEVLSSTVKESKNVSKHSLKSFEYEGVVKTYSAEEICRNDYEKYNIVLIIVVRSINIT
jgi:hypothetical protein